MAERFDGVIRALDGRPLYAHAKTAGYLAAATLRHELAAAWVSSGRRSSAVSPTWPVSQGGHGGDEPAVARPSTLLGTLTETSPTS